MSKKPLIACTPKSLPEGLRVAAAYVAIEHNPVNRPAGDHPPARLGVLTQKYWGSKGVDLTVGFMEPVNPDLRDRILSHANAWGTLAGANVKFRWSNQSPQVRITRSGGGYWSYLGTDILSIPADQPTMCLQDFTMRTPESEYRRVVRHEFGHSAGFPHEHTRRDIVALLDPARTIAYFGQTQGWGEQEVRDQILTPLEESSLIDPTRTDVLSIMTYQFPGECTISGQPIPGGLDLDELDQAYARKVYPPLVQPPVIPPAVGILPVTLVALDAAGKELGRYRLGGGTV